MEEEANNSDDERLFQSYRLKKLEDLKREQAKARSVAAGDGLRPISRDDFVKEVNEASERNIPGDEAELEDEDDEDEFGGNLGGGRGQEKQTRKGRGTGVVCFLHKDGLPASDHMRNLLNQLSPHQPLVIFVSIQGDQCIPNYPDKNIPTLLFYRAGECVGQQVGLGRRGMATTAQDVERMLLARGLADAPSESLIKASKNTESDEEDEEDDGEFGTLPTGKQGASRGLRQGGTGLGLGGMSAKRKDQDDDDSDFDM